MTNEIELELLRAWVAFAARYNDNSVIAKTSAECAASRADYRLEELKKRIASGLFKFDEQKKEQEPAPEWRPCSKEEALANPDESQWDSTPFDDYDWCDMSIELPSFRLPDSSYRFQTRARKAEK